MKPRYKLHLDGSLTMVSNAQAPAHLPAPQRGPTPYAREGERLKLQRFALGLTQVELALAIDSSLAAVKGYERGARFPKRTFRGRLAAAGIDMQFVQYGGALQ